MTPINPLVGMIEHVITHESIDWRTMARLGLQAAQPSIAAVRPVGPLRVYPSPSPVAQSTVNVRPFQTGSSSGVTTITGSMVGDSVVIDTGQMAADIAEELAGVDPNSQPDVIVSDDGYPRRFDEVDQGDQVGAAQQPKAGGSSHLWWGLGGLVLGFGIAKATQQ